MLDHAGAHAFDPLIHSAPCRVELVPELTESLTESPRAAAFSPDERQSARIPACQRAAVELHQALPAFPRTGARGQAIVCDISLRGMRFLFDQELFPGECVGIFLPEVQLGGEVARCRRLGDRCYEVGVRLDAALPPEVLKRFLQERRIPGTWE